MHGRFTRSIRLYISRKKNKITAAAFSVTRDVYSLGINFHAVNPIYVFFLAIGIKKTYRNDDVNLINIFWRFLYEGHHDGVNGGIRHVATGWRRWKHFIVSPFGFRSG